MSSGSRPRGRRPTQGPRRRLRLLLVPLGLAAFLGGAELARQGVPGLEPAATASPERTARAWVDGWARADYAAMRTLLTAADRERFPTPEALRAEFDAAIAPALPASRPVPGTPVEAARDGGRVAFRVPVRARLRRFGDVAWSATIAVVPQPGGRFAVAFAPEGVMDQLRDDWRLRRRVTAPTTGRVLDRRGRPLADLGSAGLAAQGAVGASPTLTGRPRVVLETVPRLGSAGSRLVARLDGRPGTDLRTTIEPAIQRATVAALGDRLGGAVVLAVPSGRVLSVAGDALRQLQPPGSTFKVITAAAALEDGVARETTTYPYLTKTTVGGKPIQNFEKETCGGTFVTAFAQSCNTVFAPVGARLGGQRLETAGRAFGFEVPLSTLGSGVEASTSRLGLPITDAADAGDTAIGQGQVQATPLEMAVVAATVAAGGRRPNPVLVSAPAVGDAATPAGPITAQAIPRSVARRMVALMTAVVTEGTGGAAAVPGVAVAGKTGTAELGPGQKENAWFVGFAPAARPRVAVAVLVAGGGVGGVVAAPIAGRVLAAALAATG